MIYVLTMCIGMTLGMCHSIVVQEFKTMAECHVERDYQTQHIKNVIWIKCEEKKK